MFAGRIYAPRQIELIEVPEATLDGAHHHPNEPGAILFQPQLASLCGSDLLFFDTQDEEHPPQLGHSLHEMIGVVTQTNGKQFRISDRVLCIPENQRGIFERLRASELQAVPLQPRLTDEQATLAQPLGTVICALKKVPGVLDLDVAVLGQGPIGQLFCAALGNLGAREIVAVDPLGCRLENSPRMGATTCINSSQEDPVDVFRDQTQGRMADLVVEAVGHQQQALPVYRPLPQGWTHSLFRPSSSTHQRGQLASLTGEKHHRLHQHRSGHRPRLSAGHALDL